MANNVCSQCGAPVEGSMNFCKYCGTEIVKGETIQPQQPQQVQYNPIINEAQPINAGRPQTKVPVKSKVTAGILAILLGGLGVHKFYLGKVGQGILYLLFCWTYIPAFVGLVEGIIYLTKSDEDWAEKVGYRLA